MYQPVLARFTARDPLSPDGVELLGSVSHLRKQLTKDAVQPPILVYAYVANNPLNLIDPSGMKPKWQQACSDPPVQEPPSGEPKKGDACYYPNRKVCLVKFGTVFGCWESQCVCQCAGNSLGMNCMRGCIRCADDNGAPKNTIDAEQFCDKEVCKLTNHDRNILNCCTQNNSNLGGCLGGNLAAPKNPNPGDTRCQKIPNREPKTSQCGSDPVPIV